MQLAGERRPDKQGRPNFILRAGCPIGKLSSIGSAGFDPAEEMSWTRYAIALLLFNVLGAVIVYGLQRLQLFLPLNPQKFAAVSPDSSFNTAVSFITNTNWQGYSGESTMGYLVQMAGLAVQNFLSAATGIAVAISFDPRFCTAYGQDHRQLLGRCHARDSLRAAAARRGAGAGARQSGRHREFHRLQGCDDCRKDYLSESENRRGGNLKMRRATP